MTFPGANKTGMRLRAADAPACQPTAGRVPARILHKRRVCARFMDIGLPHTGSAARRAGHAPVALLRSSAARPISLSYVLSWHGTLHCQSP